MNLTINNSEKKILRNSLVSRMDFFKRKKKDLESYGVTEDLQGYSVSYYETRIEALEALFLRLEDGVSCSVCGKSPDEGMPEQDICNSCLDSCVK